MRAIPANLREQIAALTQVEAGLLALNASSGLGLHELPLGVVHEWMTVEEGSGTRGRWIAPHGMILWLLWQMLEAEGARSAVGASPERLIAWIGRRAWPAPRAMIGAQGSRALLARSIFVDAREHRLWAAEQALACDGILATIFDAEGFDMVASRRTQLAAARSRDRPPVLALAVRPWRERTMLTAAATRWGVHPAAQESVDAPAWRAELLRGRGCSGFGGESRVLQCTAPWSWRGG